MAIAAATIGSGAAAVQPLTLSVSPEYAYGTRFGPGSVATNTIFALASGGTTPYTYSVTHVAGATFTVYTPTAANTYFTTNVTYNDVLTATYRYTVTSADGQSKHVDFEVNAVELSYG